MADIMTAETRSKVMSRIRGTNTSPERYVFTLLRAAGVKFHKHDGTLPGCPDLVFRRERVAVFIDGDFWHGRCFTDDSQYYEPIREAIESSNRRPIFQLRRSYVRESMSGVCLSLMANMREGGHNQPVIKGRCGIWKLTPRNCAS